MRGDQPGDITALIVHVAQMDGACAHPLTSLDTGRPLALVQEMRAEVTRFSDAMRSLGTFCVRPVGIFFEVEIPDIVGTGNHAVPASYAPVMIDNDDAVLTFVRGLYRTNLGAGRIFTVIAQQKHGFFGRIVDVFFFDSYLSNPMNVVPLISEKGYIVFFPARFCTCAAIRQALIDVDNHPPFEADQRTPFAGIGWAATGQQGQPTHTGSSR
jgi:hypothetical protein